MLNHLNKYSLTMWRLICHGRRNLCNFGIPTAVCTRGSVCHFTNISSCEARIRGDGKNSDKILVSAPNVINVCTKGNKDHVHLNNYQKCKFHSSPIYSAKYSRYGSHQDAEKRRAYTLIFLTVFIAGSVLWGYSKMDLSPYDKPAQKAEEV